MCEGFAGVDGNGRPHADPHGGCQEHEVRDESTDLEDLKTDHVCTVHSEIGPESACTRESSK